MGYVLARLYMMEFCCSHPCFSQVGTGLYWVHYTLPTSLVVDGYL